MQQFYSIETGGMLPKDGSFDEAGYREFLENIRRLGAYEGIGNESAGYRKVEFDGKYDVAMWAGGVYAAHVTELDSLFTAAVLGEALQQREGMFRLLGENRGGLYVPRTVLGVNAGGQTELAVEFVKTVLSEAVQSNNFEDGLPVNRGALRRNMENPNPTQPYAASFSTSWGDHEGSITLTWPEQRYFEDIVRQMEALEQPVTENAAIRELILGQSVRFFSGDSSLEDTAKELRQRIDLVLAE